MKLDDEDIYRGLFSPVCTFCKHKEKDNNYKCAAFDKIPLPIWMGNNDHRKPYPGDHGIQFEPIEGDNAN